MLGILCLGLIVSTTYRRQILLHIACGVEDLEYTELLLAVVNDGELDGKACCNGDMVEATLPLVSTSACSLRGDGEVNLSLLSELLLQTLHGLGALLAIDRDTT